MALPWEENEEFPADESDAEELAASPYDESELEDPEVEVPEEEEVVVNASRTARALAEENDVDLTTIIGSGRTGRIVKADVEALLPEPEVEVEAEIIPLDTIDRQLLSTEEEAEPDDGEPFIPAFDVDFPSGTKLIDEAQAETLLGNASYRFRRVSPRVAYLGQGRQKYFVLYLASWQVNRGGIFYVPEQLADYETLLSEEWERLQESAAPAGFVAFRAV